MAEQQLTFGEGRAILQVLDESFARLHENSCKLLNAIPSERLYAHPHGAGENALPRRAAGERTLSSCGEQVLRAAAAVEQTFGGITANLWDDPFEWTLPEELSTPQRVVEYLNEVEATRRRGFTLIETDAALLKDVALPSGGTQTLCALLVETLARSAHHQGRALAAFESISANSQPRV